MDDAALGARYGRIFQKAFENASLGVVISSRERGYSLVNNAFVSLVGYSREELVQKSFEDITHPDDLARNIELVQRLLRHEIPFYELEKRFVRKDGSTVWVNVHMSLIDLDDEKNIFFAIVRDIEAEVKGRVEQTKLLTLVENSVELMSILGMDGRNSYLNKAGREMLGFADMAEVLQTPISALHLPEHFEQVSREVLPAVMNEGRWSGTMLVRNLKTGEVFPVHNNTVRIDDEVTGEPLAVGAVMRDLRKELSAQDAVIQSERRFRAMIEQAPVAIGLLKGEDMVIESANETMLEVWGKSADVIGRKLIEALPEIKGQPFMSLLREVYKSGKPYYGYETKAQLVRDKGLQDYYFNLVYAPIAENGKTSSVLVVATEVTTQVVATLRLAESEQRFRNLIAEAPMATAVYIGENMVIQLANDAMIRLWGKDESVIGKPVLEAVPEIQDQEFPRLLRQVYETGEPYHSADHPGHLVVDGKLQLFYFNFTYKPLKNAEGKVYGILNMAVDVTKQVLIAEELEQKVQQRTIRLQEANAHLENVNSNLEQFAYITSHDLQEPLRKIRIFSDILLNRFREQVDPQVASYLTRIATSSRRMSDLIHDVLDYSRIGSEDRMLAPVDLNRVFEQLLIDFDLLIKEKDATVTVSPLPVVQAIPLQMNQLFYNLLANSLKFSAPARSPVIEVSVKSHEEVALRESGRLDNNLSYVAVSIKDNGIGFNEEFAGNIFTIFHRLHHKDAYEGTGIGLAICKKIVESHKGYIKASALEGEGAEFTVILPVNLMSLSGNE